MEENMAIKAIDAISNAGATAYQGGTAAQTRPVEAVKATDMEQASGAYQKVQQAAQTQQKSNKASDEKSIEKDNEKIKKAVNDLNKKMSNTFCQFGVHEGTGRITLKILDKDTKEIVKEYPAEETLEMIEKVWELAGIMVDREL